VLAVKLDSITSFRIVTPQVVVEIYVPLGGTLTKKKLIAFANRVSSPQFVATPKWLPHIAANLAFCYGQADSIFSLLVALQINTLKLEKRLKLTILSVPTKNQISKMANIFVIFFFIE